MEDQGVVMKTEVTYRGAVYPWHCDHVGHMNVMWYVGKFDEATWNLFARIGLTPAYLRETGRGMAAVQQNITYKRELLASDVVEVRSSLLEIGNKSIRFVHEMRNAETGEIAAICEITGVHLDRQARKSVAFAETIRRRAADFIAHAEAVIA
jgi:acyl-CoA thioester hydrolase